MSQQVEFNCCHFVTNSCLIKFEHNIFKVKKKKREKYQLKIITILELLTIMQQKCSECALSLVMLPQEYYGLIAFCETALTLKGSRVALDRKQL